MTTRRNWQAGSVLVVTGLGIEARIAAGPGIVTLRSGGNVEQLRALLSEIDLGACRAIVSFGLAGGLDPSLRPGDIVVATDVVCDDTTWSAHPAVTAALKAGLTATNLNVVHGTVVGSGMVVLDPAAKADLHGTGGIAVDMESHVAAEFADTHGLAFGVVRVICDPASRRLPPLALRALDQKGRIDLSEVFGSLARNPLQLAELVRTGRDFSAGVASLRRCRRLLGLGFGLTDRLEFVLDVP